jgi:hypothetical protein
MNTTPWANGPGSGGSTISLGAGSFSMGTSVLWSEAPVAIAVSSAGVSISWVMAFHLLSRFGLGRMTRTGRAIHRTTAERR